MRVKVHPHRTMVNSGVEACVSVTPDVRGGLAYYMGTVGMLDGEFRIHQSGVKRAQAEQVRNVHAWAVGKLDFQSPEQLPQFADDDWVQVTYHFNMARFMTLEDEPVDVTDGHFERMLFVGRNFYVTKEW